MPSKRKKPVGSAEVPGVAFGDANPAGQGKRSNGSTGEMILTDYAPVRIEGAATGVGRCRVD